MMFDRLLARIREAIITMISKSEFKNKFNVDFDISDKMSQSIELWGNIYENRSPWLDKNTTSLNLGAAISNEIARLVTLEMETGVTGSARADFINEIYQEFIKDNITKAVEYGCAKGGVVFKPFISTNKIGIDIIQADKFYPTAYDTQGNIRGGIFVSQKVMNNIYYTRLEYQHFENGVYIIDNMAFKSQNKESLGLPIPLSAVEDWANIQPRTTIRDLEKPLFAYFKIPYANQIDTESNLGVSAFSRAVDLIEQADKQYSRILWEFEGSELAVDADITALQSAKTMTKQLSMPKLKDRLFRATGQSRDGSFYQVFSPAIRDVSLFNGLNQLLRKIEFNCGLAYGTISDPQNEDKTATEVKQSRQRTYANVSMIQRSLEKALNDLIYCMDAFCTLYGIAPAGTYETSFKWDDSIIVDADVERKQDIQDISIGVMTLAEYRAKWYGESLEEAQSKLPVQADITE